MSLSVYPRKIQWQDGMNYAGRHRNLGLAFAFISAKCEQVAAFTSCRDYLHDMMFAQVNEWEACAYTDYVVGKSPKISVTQLRIAVVNTNAGANNFSLCIDRALRFVHKIEDSLGIKNRSKAYMIKNPPNSIAPSDAFLYTADSTWMLSGPMLSLYTLALRVGFGAIENAPFEDTLKGVASGRHRPYDYRDSSIVKTAIPGIERIKQEGVKKIFFTDPRANYPTNARGNTHSSYGIAGFSSGGPRTCSASWYPKNWTAPVNYDVL